MASMEKGRKTSKSRRDDDVPPVQPLPREMLGPTAPLLSSSPPPASNPLDIPGSSKQSSPRTTAQLGAHRPAIDSRAAHRRSASFGSQDGSAFRPAFPTGASPSTSPRSATEKGSPRETKESASKSVSKADIVRRIDTLEDDIVQAYDLRLAQLEKKLDTTIGALQARFHAFNEAIAGVSRHAVYASNPRGNLETIVQPWPVSRYRDNPQQRPPPRQGPDDREDSSCHCFSWLTRFF